MSKKINPNTKQNPIPKIKLNQNKQIWKKKEKEKKKKEQADLTQRQWRCWSDD